MNVQIARKVNDFIDRLVQEYKYKPLPPDKSQLARKWYKKHLPYYESLIIKDVPLHTRLDTQIAEYGDRIVIGDYGAFIEFSTPILENICIPKKQEYRQSERFISNVKYLWYTAKDDSGCKIYYQLKTVPYADYIVGKYYVSPYEVY